VRVIVNTSTTSSSDSTANPLPSRDELEPRGPAVRPQEANALGRGDADAVAFENSQLEGARQRGETLADDASPDCRYVPQRHVEGRRAIVEHAARLAKAPRAQGTALIGRRIRHACHDPAGGWRGAYVMRSPWLIWAAVKIWPGSGRFPLTARMFQKGSPGRPSGLITLTSTIRLNLGDGHPARVPRDAFPAKPATHSNGNPPHQWKVARVFAFASASMPHLRNSASSAWDFWSREMRRACEERARPGTPHRGAYERRHGPPTQDRRERCDLALRTGRAWPDPRQLRAGSSDPKAAVPASRA
jgi:hypothetical protein